MASETNPFGDVTTMMAQFKMPGIDMGSIVEARRKDIDALVEANKATFASMQALAQKQTEMLSDAMAGMQDAAKSFAGGSSLSDPIKHAEVVRKGFEKTLANMKELAEMARHAQSDTMTRISQRAAHQMQDIKTLVTSK
jgi:phasin family protein